jgi:Core-2/I-Branching enzyme
VRIAYVVLSHRNPDQVLRLVAALKEGPAAEVLVRHDERRSHLDEAELERLGARALHDGIEFEWGGWTQLQLLLSCLACAAELDPDWLLVLSGQDYPLRPIDEIEAGLAGSEHDAMLGRAWELDTDRLPGPPADEFFLRYAYRHYLAPAGTPRLPRAVRPLAYLREMPPPLRPRLGVRRASLPFDNGFRCYVSADWLTLNRRALGAVLTAARERRRLMRYYRRAAIPSESYFATVLLNDSSLRVARDDRRFISFAAPLTPHPDTLTGADLDRLLASECYFARKFDVETDAEVLDALDERRRSRSPR